MYNGWTESPEQTEARKQRILDAQERARQERENAEIAQWLGEEADAKDWQDQVSELRGGL